MKRKKRCTYTPEQAIKLWQLCNLDKLTQVQAAKIVGCNKGAANRWINLVKDTPALLAKAKKDGKGKSRKTLGPEGALGPKPLSYLEGGPASDPLERSVDKIVALEEENKFLKWWNEGERNGWVDQLLKKVQE